MPDAIQHQNDLGSIMDVVGNGTHPPNLDSPTGKWVDCMRGITDQSHSFTIDMIYQHLVCGLL